MSYERCSSKYSQIKFKFSNVNQKVVRTHYFTGSKLQLKTVLLKTGSAKILSEMFSKSPTESCTLCVIMLLNLKAFLMLSKALSFFADI